MSQTTIHLVEFVEGRRSIIGQVTVHSDGTLVGSIAPQEVASVVESLVNHGCDLAVIPIGRRG